MPNNQRERISTINSLIRPLYCVGNWWCISHQHDEKQTGYIAIVLDT